MIENDLFDYLDANTAGVTFAQTLAMPDALPPLVEITMQNNRRTRTTGTTSVGRVTEFELECWDKNTALAKTLSDSIIALLQDYTGNLSGTSDVMATRIINEFQGSDSAAELYYSTFTVIFTHK
jgi:hypothetical protein